MKKSPKNLLQALSFQQRWSGSGTLVIDNKTKTKTKKKNLEINEEAVIPKDPIIYESTVVKPVPLPNKFQTDLSKFVKNIYFYNIIRWGYIKRKS